MRFTDDRYITVDSKPVFIVYNPYDLPEPQRYTDLWRELALKAGLKGLYFIGQVDHRPWIAGGKRLRRGVYRCGLLLSQKMNGYYNGLGRIYQAWWPEKY